MKLTEEQKARCIEVVEHYASYIFAEECEPEEPMNFWIAIGHAIDPKQY